MTFIIICIVVILIIHFAKSDKGIKDTITNDINKLSDSIDEATTDKYDPNERAKSIMMLAPFSTGHALDLQHFSYSNKKVDIIFHDGSHLCANLDCLEVFFLYSAYTNIFSVTIEYQNAKYQCGRSCGMYSPIFSFYNDDQKVISVLVLAGKTHRKHVASSGYCNSQRMMYNTRKNLQRMQQNTWNNMNRF